MGKTTSIDTCDKKRKDPSVKDEKIFYKSSFYFVYSDMSAHE